MSYSSYTRQCSMRIVYTVMALAEVKKITIHAHIVWFVCAFKLSRGYTICTQHKHYETPCRPGLPASKAQSPPAVGSTTNVTLPKDLDSPGRYMYWDETPRNERDCPSVCLRLHSLVARVRYSIYAITKPFDKPFDSAIGMCHS